MSFTFRLTTSRLNWLMSVLGCMLLAVLTMVTQIGHNLEFNGYLNHLFNQVSVFTLTGLFQSDMGLLTTAGKITFLFSMLFGMLTTSVISLVFIWLPRNHSLQKTLQGLQDPSLIFFLVADLVFLWIGFGLLFWISGMGDISIPESIFNALSALANDGVTLGVGNAVPFANSTPLILVWSAAILVGGGGLPLRARVYRWALGKIGCQRFIPREMVGEKWYVEAILFMTIFIKVLGTILLFGLEGGNLNPLAYEPGTLSLTMAFFHAVSSSTAGFNAVDISTLTSGSHWVLILLMFIGAAPNSWGGGGVKLLAFVWVIYVCFLVNDNNSIKIRGYAREALARIAIAVCIIPISTKVGIIAQPSLDSFTFFFEVVSGFTNTGYSLGITTTLSPFNMINLMFIEPVLNLFLY